jgi:copper chaperone CopZ
MKNLHQFLGLVMILSITAIFIPSCSSAQASTADLSEVEIKTSANCGSCKITIESALEKTEGVSYSNLDLGNKVVTVKYDAEVTDPATIRKAIAASGYDADDVMCDKTAHDNLAACCQKGADPH